MHRTILCLLLAALPLHAQQGPPRDNPYDVIGKIFQPFWSVLLADTKSPNHAASLSIEMSEVSGRLPANMKGATLKGAVQFPDKVKLEAPVLGEQFTICRNGNEVWATPGSKVEFLIAQFKVKPKKKPAKTHNPDLPSRLRAAGGVSSGPLLHEARGCRRDGIPQRRGLPGAHGRAHARARACDQSRGLQNPHLGGGRLPPAPHRSHPAGFHRGRGHPRSLKRSFVAGFNLAAARWHDRYLSNDSRIS